MLMERDVLVSRASVAGPALAFWLARRDPLESLFSDCEDGLEDPLGRDVPQLMDQASRMGRTCMRPSMIAIPRSTTGRRQKCSGDLTLCDRERPSRVIIDCHGHYTTAPQAHTDWRTDQLAAYEHGRTAPDYPRLDASLKAKGR